MNLSIVIPFYNEEKTITVVLNKLINMTWPAVVEKLEIICVDDASTDDSFDIVMQLVEQHNFIKLHRLETNKGKGAAVRHGIKKAKGDVYFIQDADLELEPLDIPSLITAMDELGVQFVNGSRYLPGIIRPLSSYRRYRMNRLFTNMTNWFINVHLTDMACGYKLIAKELYDQISLKEDRFGFEAELILKAIRIKKNNVAEVPVHYYPRNTGEGKKIRNIDGIRILKTIFLYGLLRLK